ncbi:MAG: YaiO family outer membrane beta-barrel protein [Bacteroidia bacterium]
MSLRFKHLIITLLFLVPVISTKGQGRGSDTLVVITDSTDLDALFKKARDFSYNDNNAQARRICQKILEKNPAYYDVRTFMGRTYAWDKMYDQARTELSRVLIERENDYEALNALFDVEFWSENYEVANDYLKIALGYYPNSEELLIKKAKLQIKLEDKDNAALTLRRVLDINPGQKDAQQLMNSLEGRKLNNTFQTSYTVDQFAKGRSAQMLYIAELGRNFNFGSLAMRINAANKFNKKGFQYEVESYVHFTKGIYADLLCGFANDSVFPGEKYGAEVYFKLPAGFELSGGIRYQKFAKSTTYYTTSIGNYFKDYWFSFRMFFTPKTDSVVTDVTLKNASITSIVSIRKYYGDGNNFAGIKFIRGQSPDELKTLDVAKTTLSYSGGIEVQRNAFGRWFVKAELTYAREGIVGTRYSERVSSVLTVKTIF